MELVASEQFNSRNGRRLKKVFTKPLRQTQSDSLVTGQRETIPNSDSAALLLPTKDYDRYEPLPHNNVARDAVADRLSEIISLIDEGSWPESEKDVVIILPNDSSTLSTRGFASQDAQEGSKVRGLWPTYKIQPTAQPLQPRSVNILTKLKYYDNSRLPPSLPPFRVYISTYPLLCLAALCSANAYQGRQNAVRDEQLISADARIGTKAMVIKSVACADSRTIVIAIRGTSVLSLRDWNVNLNTVPQSPAGFLDDDGNYCHSGFLHVARAMVTPIAVHLRHLLEENPTRLSYSLLITGHSAGGAVASLLYAHMLSDHVKSDLTVLTDCFKRVHCVTFGAPPVSLLPLRKPPHKEARLHKWLFYSFINEGDPVARAEKSYVRSLVDLLITPAPSESHLKLNVHGDPVVRELDEGLSADLSLVPTSGFKPMNQERGTKAVKQTPFGKRLAVARRAQLKSAAEKLLWKVPPSTLSNAGQLVVLRGPEPPPTASTSQVDLTKEFEEVKAFTVTDEQIRTVIFGDPLMHAMDVYRRRIEALAMKAVTGRDSFY